MKRSDHLLACAVALALGISFSACGGEQEDARNGQGDGTVNDRRDIPTQSVDQGSPATGGTGTGAAGTGTHDPAQRDTIGTHDGGNGATRGTGGTGNQ